MSIWIRKVGRGKPRQSGEFSIGRASELCTGRDWQALEARSSGAVQVREPGGRRQVCLCHLVDPAVMTRVSRGEASNREACET